MTKCYDSIIHHSLLVLYYLTHNWKDKGVPTFPKGNSQKLTEFYALNSIITVFYKNGFGIK